MANLDGFVKSPSAALPCILRRCGVLCKYASLLRFCAPGPAKRGRTFYAAIFLATFYETINLIKDPHLSSKQKNSFPQWPTNRGR
ncbi:MAG: hypothetical protein NTY64_20730 [Deltaproteobacteria bacterium]|nr:hypothetical protein [Deltaproteobacteria bacterium]